VNFSAIERYRDRVRSIEDDPAFLTEGVKAAFAEELCRLMEEAGVSRTQLAERIGVSRAYITRILRTDYNLTAETMVKLALALGARVSLHLHTKDKRASWREIPRAEAMAQAQSSRAPRNRPYAWRERQDVPVVADKPATRTQPARGTRASGR